MGEVSCKECGKLFKTYYGVFCSRLCYWKNIRTGFDQKKYNDEYYRLYRKKIILKIKERRHLRGISKRYKEEINAGLSREECKKLYRQRRKALVKGGGELNIKTIQQVYEDNIKKYSTLTCYLCELSILFGKDHLEHKTPLSRGGTNERDNLDIACQKCNCKKNNKTETEYRKFKSYV